ncbi:uncharacterized protein MONBRDRAFT_32971 [Monosiga brevicollis MX1]|uniref:Myb-like domain-containing protein n=1 Tax=Monosiga brevicollis TaxID=81824 RepID=A9V2S9_MONBE|nr:uncharacterized protein MONBRDRAFT_32971 [Monosiga brevicollis MX1]EDQ87938.1 predicted protein [Monosiga brevicollis MX1]|eukprot:XP_001747014.1 hypothetical protein [Monosiga brevicollis MX1]
MTGVKRWKWGCRAAPFGDACAEGRAAITIAWTRNGSVLNDSDMQILRDYVNLYGKTGSASDARAYLYDKRYRDLEAKGEIQSWCVSISTINRQLKAIESQVADGVLNDVLVVPNERRPASFKPTTREACLNYIAFLDALESKHNILTKNRHSLISAGEACVDAASSRHAKGRHQRVVPASRCNVSCFAAISYAAERVFLQTKVGIETTENTQSRLEATIAAWRVHHGPQLLVITLDDVRHHRNALALMCGQQGLQQCQKTFVRSSCEIAPEDAKYCPLIYYELDEQQYDGPVICVLTPADQPDLAPVMAVCSTTSYAAQGLRAQGVQTARLDDQLVKLLVAAFHGYLSEQMVLDAVDDTIGYINAWRCGAATEHQARAIRDRQRRRNKESYEQFRQASSSGSTSELWRMARSKTRAGRAAAAASTTTTRGVLTQTSVLEAALNPAMKLRLNEDPEAEAWWNIVQACLAGVQTLNGGLDSTLVRRLNIVKCTFTLTQENGRDASALDDSIESFEQLLDEFPQCFEADAHRILLRFEMRVQRLLAFYLPGTYGDDAPEPTESMFLEFDEHAFDEECLDNGRLKLSTFTTRVLSKIRQDPSKYPDYVSAYRDWDDFKRRALTFLQRAYDELPEPLLVRAVRHTVQGPPPTGAAAPAAQVASAPLKVLGRSEVQQLARRLQLEEPFNSAVQGDRTSAASPPTAPRMAANPPASPPQPKAKRQNRQPAAPADLDAPMDELDAILMQQAAQTRSPGTGSKQAARTQGEADPTPTAKRAKNSSAPSAGNSASLNGHAGRLLAASRHLKGIGADPIDEFRRQAPRTGDTVSTLAPAAASVRTAPAVQATPTAASQEEDGTIASPNTLPSPTARRRAGATRARRAWTEEEEMMLEEGVAKFGKKWRAIQAHYDFKDRTNVDLKDKWRNMSRN